METLVSADEYIYKMNPMMVAVNREERKTEGGRWKTEAISKGMPAREGRQTEGLKILVHVSDGVGTDEGTDE